MIEVVTTIKTCLHEKLPQQTLDCFLDRWTACFDAHSLWDWLMGSLCSSLSSRSVVLYTSDSLINVGSDRWLLRIVLSGSCNKSDTTDTLELSDPNVFCICEVCVFNNSPSGVLLLSIFSWFSFALSMEVIYINHQISNRRRYLNILYLFDEHVVSSA